jgi:hypothetical protein
MGVDYVNRIEHLADDGALELILYELHQLRLRLGRATEFLAQAP